MTYIVLAAIVAVVVACKVGHIRGEYRGYIDASDDYDALCRLMARDSTREKFESECI